MADFGSAKKFKEDSSSVTYICSRYYRAPELILGEENYKFEVDIWSAGCVIAEMFAGTPLFAGKNTADQLLKIVKVLGTPEKDYLAELLKLRDIHLSNIKGCGLEVKLPDAEPLLLDLLKKTLTYDPNHRIRPLEALLHPYFDELRQRPVFLDKKLNTDLFNFSREELGDEESLLPHWYHHGIKTKITSINHLNYYLKESYV